MSRALIVSWLFLFLLAAGALTYVENASQNPTAFVTVSAGASEPVTAVLLAIAAIACLFVASRE